MCFLSANGGSRRIMISLYMRFPGAEVLKLWEIGMPAVTVMETTGGLLRDLATVGELSCQMPMWLPSLTFRRQGRTSALIVQQSKQTNIKSADKRCNEFSPDDSVRKLDRLCRLVLLEEERKFFPFSSTVQKRLYLSTMPQSALRLSNI